MPPPTLSLTESQALTALRSFLVGALPSGVDVIRGQVNRVPEPAGPNFVVFWPIRQERLSTNVVTYTDAVATASIAGTIATVTQVISGALQGGGTLIDGSGVIAANTVISGQLSGSLGGTGTYRVSPSQTVPSETVFSGRRLDLVPTMLVVQLDVHGPASGDNVKVIEGLFRSEYGTTAFGNAELAPLYCETPQQVPFINAEQQYEDRWTMNACVQVNPVIGTPQQFATELEIDLVDVVTKYPP